MTGQWYPKATIINHPLPILFTHIIPKIIVTLKFLVSTGIPVVCGVANTSYKLSGEKWKPPNDIILFLQTENSFRKKTNIVRQRSLLIKIVCFICILLQ